LERQNGGFIATGGNYLKQTHPRPLILPNDFSKLDETKP